MHIDSLKWILLTNVLQLQSCEKVQTGQKMYANAAGDAVTSLNGAVIPAQVAMQGMRSDPVSATAVMTLPRGLELLEVQQRVQLFDYAQRAQHYQRLQAALMPTAGRVFPNSSSPVQSQSTTAPALACSGLLSFIYSKLQDASPSQQHLRFLQAAAAAAAAATTQANHHDEPKPSQSYIGLIAMAILSSTERKLVLSDIYQWILDHYAYFRYRGPGWRNSIRHNLSLNDCFVKAGRSANGKGHYWAIHPANVEDFERGDFRRRRAQRKVRRAMGLSVPDDDDSPGPSPSASSSVVALSPSYCSWTPSKSPPFFFTQRSHALTDDWNRLAASAAPTNPLITHGSQRPHDASDYRRDQASGSAEKSNVAVGHQQPRVRRRLFDMDSILASDDQLSSRDDVTADTRTINTELSRHHHQRDEERISYTLLDSNDECAYKVTCSRMI